MITIGVIALVLGLMQFANHDSNDDDIATAASQTTGEVSPKANSQPQSTPKYTVWQADWYQTMSDEQKAALCISPADFTMKDIDPNNPAAGKTFDKISHDKLTGKDYLSIDDNYTYKHYTTDNGVYVAVDAYRSDLNSSYQLAFVKYDTAKPTEPMYYPPFDPETLNDNPVACIPPTDSHAEQVISDYQLQKRIAVREEVYRQSDELSSTIVDRIMGITSPKSTDGYQTERDIPLNKKSEYTSLQQSYRDQLVQQACAHTGTSTSCATDAEWNKYIAQNDIFGTTQAPTPPEPAPKVSESGDTRYINDARYW